MSPPETAVLNGIVYQVLAEAPLGRHATRDDPQCRRLVLLRRPNGRREILAKDYGPHPIYGDNRREDQPCLITSPWPETSCGRIWPA
jgi:hypothetical protein